MAKKMSCNTKKERQAGARSATARAFGAMADAGANCYLRPRDLPRLIALWPRELEDASPEGSVHILSKLKRALRAERRRALAGHWSYDLNRHLGLMSAYKAELALLRRMGPRLTRNTPGAEQPRSGAGGLRSAAGGGQPVPGRPR